MTFRVLKNEIRDIVSAAAKNMGYNKQDFDILDPPRKEFGDLSCNIAFRVSKKFKKHPFEIANEIVNKQLIQLLEYKRKSNSGSLVLSVEAHPTGYINFKADLSKLASITLNNALQCPDYGFYNIGNNSFVIIEHTSVNPNKALHVG